MTVKAANTKTTLKISDTRKEPAYVDPKGYDWTGPPTVLSELVVPVLIDAEAIAVLCVDSTRPDAFNDEDQKLLETLAIHVGSALGRLRHEEELRKSEERYHTLFQSMLEGFAYCKMIFDDKGRPLDFVYLDVNSAFGLLTGLEDVVGKRVTEVIPGIKEQHPELFEIYGRVALTGKPEKFEIDLKPLGLSLAISVSSPTKGKFIAVFENITERKRTEEALRASEEKYRSLVENAADFIFMIDGKNRTVLSANRSAARPFGKEPEEIQGKSIFELFPKEMAGEYAENLNEVIKTGKGKIYESKMVAEGKEIWISTSLNPVNDIDGKVSSVLGASRDITERTHMEKALQESEEKYRAMVENSPSLIGIFQDGVLKYVNSAGIIKLGWTYEELVSPSFDPMENVVSQKSKSLLKENVGKRLRGEDIAPYEVSLTRKDGSTVPVLVRGAKIIYNQKPAIEFIFDDITERKLAENTLKKSENHFREAMEATNDGLWDWNVETGETYNSPAYYRMLGYEPGDFPNNIQFWVDHIHSDDRAQAIKANEDCIENRVSNFEVEFRMRTKSGGWKWILGRGRTSARDANGRALRMIGTHQDITERKSTEEKLRHSEERYHSLFDRMLDGVYLQHA